MDDFGQEKMLVGGVAETVVVVVLFLSVERWRISKLRPCSSEVGIQWNQLEMVGS